MNRRQLFVVLLIILRWVMDLCRLTTLPLSFNERITKLKAFTRGWVNYYKYAHVSGKLKELDGWVRNRLRYCIWKHWKKPNKLMRSYIRLGISKGQAYAWSRSRMGGWAIAQSPMMRTTVTLERLKMKGYLSFSEQFQKSRRSVSNVTQLELSFVWWTAQYETRTLGGPPSFHFGGYMWKVHQWA